MELDKLFTILVERIERMADASLGDELKSCSRQAVQDIDSSAGCRLDFGFKPITELWMI